MPSCALKVSFSRFLLAVLLPAVVGCERFGTGSSVEACGNGIVEASFEECDDGNTVGGDGCAADCTTVEAHFSCPEPGSPCVYDGSAADDAADSLLAPSLPRIVFDIDTVLNRVPLFGYNMIAANRGFGIVDESGAFNTEIVEAVQRIKPRLLRFPGGTYANLYEWKRAIGPRENRGGMHGWKHIPDDNWFGPDEAAQFIEIMDGELVCVVNLNEGAQYAADWVEYMNANVGDNPNGGTDWAQVRADNGRFEPYGVRYWEIANEGGNGRIWSGWPARGDGEPLDFGDPVFQDLTVYGGARTFTRDKLVRHNAWRDDFIATQGVPNEAFRFRWRPVVRSSVSLRVGDTPDDATNYTLVENFASSGPDDRHFTIDEHTGQVIFGDGVNGEVLPGGKYVFVDYTTQFKDGHTQIYDAMKGVDPGIKIAEAFWFIRAYMDADPLNVQADGTQIHAATETMGDFGLYYGEDTFENAMSLALGSVPTYIQRQIDSYQHPGDIFLTEYGIFKETLVNSVQHAKTITSAIYYMLYGAALAERGDRIPMAAINYLSNHGDNREAAFPEATPVIAANGYATAMYTQHFGKELVSVASQNIPERSLEYDEFPWSKSSTVRSFPKLYSLASINREARKAYLLVINSTKTEMLRAWVRAKGTALSMSRLDRIVRLRSTSLSAVNTAGEPDNITIIDQEVPLDQVGSLEWEFPPATATSFTFDFGVDGG